MRFIHRFIEISYKEKTLFIEALLFLFYSKILLSIFPFKTCIKRFKSIEQLNHSIDISTLKDVRTAISRANKLAFWKNICIVNSFAARMMLQSRGIASVMHLGLRYKNSTNMEAHAWLMVGDINITPKGEENYKEIYHF